MVEWEMCALSLNFPGTGGQACLCVFRAEVPAGPGQASGLHFPYPTAEQQVVLEPWGDSLVSPHLDFPQAGLSSALGPRIPWD